MAQKRKLPRGQKARQIKGRPKPTPRWRPNCIKLWIKHAKLTDQKVADRLEELGDPDLALDRVSVTRIKNGEQRTGITVIEAIQRIVGAPNLDALLNHAPEDYKEVEQFQSLPPTEQRKALKLLDTSREP